jgi:hypothetical protein
MDGFLLAGLIIGFLSVSAYVGYGVISHKIALMRQSQGVQCFLSGLSVVVGVKVCSKIIVAVFGNSFGSLVTSGDCPYFFLGGIALIWVSIETLARAFQSISQS